jgi:hypothetical protein
VSRYTDFEIACLSDAVMNLSERLTKEESPDEHYRRVFVELSHVYRLLQLDDMANECMKVVQRFDSGYLDLKDRYDELDEEVDKLLKKLNVEDLEDIEDFFVRIPEGMEYEEAKEALAKAAEESTRSSHKA